MNPKDSTFIIEDFLNKEKLINAGKLPNIDSLYKRMAYVGHELVRVYVELNEDKVYRCVLCMHDWQGDGEQCNICQSDKEVFQLNICRSARWRCIACAHEWDGIDGYECPQCHVLKNEPRWTCEHCSNEWIGDKCICTKCGADYYD